MRTLCKCTSTAARKLKTQEGRQHNKGGARLSARTVAVVKQLEEVGCSCALPYYRVLDHNKALPTWP
jgi:hypothetical protein